MSEVRLARNMMATRFELILRGENKSRLQALGESALDEIDVLERRLSFYRPSSELSVLNRQACERPVAVAPDLLNLLQRAKKLFCDTRGAFDPTIGPLMKCWGASKDSIPDPEIVKDALARTGMNHVHIDAEKGTIGYEIEGLEIDLGGIAKGYAIEYAVEFLRSAGIENVLLHGGTSTVAALGTSSDGRPWKIGISDQEHLLATVEIRNESLSVSAQSGKTRIIDGVKYGHIINPTSGWPVNNTAVAAVVCPRATECDALSTAALVLGDKTLHAAAFRRDTFGVAVWGPPEASYPAESPSRSRTQSAPPFLLFQKGMPAFAT